MSVQTISKQLYPIDSASQPFQMMTSRKVQDFLINPKENATARQIHEHVQNISFEVFARIENCRPEIIYDWVGKKYFGEDIQWKQKCFIHIEFYQDNRDVKPLDGDTFRD